MADAVLGGGLARFGVSEPDHVSDLRATEAQLVATGDRFRLTGTKWPVGNATRGRFVTALARAGEEKFSLALVDKRVRSAARPSG